MSGFRIVSKNPYEKQLSEAPSAVLDDDNSPPNLEKEDEPSKPPIRPLKNQGMRMHTAAKEGKKGSEDWF